MSSEPAPSRLAFPARPLPLRADVPRRVTLPDYLPARMVNEYVYCPRLFFSEWVDGVFAGSSDTVEGSLRHEKVDSRTDGLPKAGETDTERIHVRSVSLASDALGLIATIDVLEGTGSTVTPVDYKRGAPREGPDGLEAWPTDRVQSAVQALVLREHAYTCDEAVVYYDTTRQRVRVPIDDALLKETLEAVKGARALAEGGLIPPPLADSPKCVRCSLVPICLPDETAAALGLADDDRQLALFDHPGDPGRSRLEVPPEPEQIRRLVPARDDLRPLYVIGHGLTVGKSGGVLQIREARGGCQPLQEARLHDVSQVNVFGSVQVTSGALQALCYEEKPIGHFSTGGWFTV